MAGTFVISLDFELMWGVRDKKTVSSYGQEIKKVHQIIPEMLSIFRQYGVKATFATVGFLFAQNESDIDANLPSKKPSYIDRNLSPYEELIDRKGNFSDPHFFCYPLIELIQKEYPEQELGTHTFSHYYCLEDGQNVEEFKSDLTSAIQIAKEKGIETKSIVFPRNQAAPDYIEACKQNGVIAYRGVEKAWFYRAQANKEESKLKRAFRLLDTYINISGHNTFSVSEDNGIVNIPSSRFLRPYSDRLSFLEQQKIARIKNGMTHAAKQNEVFHLWWHPHNFGYKTNEMFSQLKCLLEHFSILHKTYQFESRTMRQIAETHLK